MAAAGSGAMLGAPLRGAGIACPTRGEDVDRDGRVGHGVGVGGDVAAARHHQQRRRLGGAAGCGTQLGEVGGPFVGQGLRGPLMAARGAQGPRAHHDDPGHSAEHRHEGAVGDHPSPHGSRIVGVHAEADEPIDAADEVRRDPASVEQQRRAVLLLERATRGGAVSLSRRTSKMPVDGTSRAGVRPDQRADAIRDRRDHRRDAQLAHGRTDVGAAGEVGHRNADAQRSDRPRITDATTAAVPLLKNQGTRGTRAPRANATNDDDAAATGEPVDRGLTPSSSRVCTSRASSGSLASAVATWSAASWGTPRET